MTIGKLTALIIGSNLLALTGFMTKDDAVGYFANIYILKAFLGWVQ
jgi:hypothetical protein